MLFDDTLDCRDDAMLMIIVMMMQNCHPQNIGLVKTRGEALGLQIVVGDIQNTDFSSKDYSGAMVQYPDTFGGVHDWSGIVERLHSNDVLAVACTDLLASTVLKPVGELGFDIAVGSSQRFGVPMVFRLSTSS